MTSQNPSNKFNAISDIVQQLINNFTELFNTQINLEIPFSSDVSSSASTKKNELLSVGSYLLMGALSLTITATTLVFIGFTLMFFLSIFMPLWIASFAVVTVFSFVALVLYMSFKIHIRQLKRMLLRVK